MKSGIGSDVSGHGTKVIANLLSIAPKVSLHVVQDHIQINSALNNRLRLSDSGQPVNRISENRNMLQLIETRSSLGVSATSIVNVSKALFDPPQEILSKIEGRNILLIISSGNFGSHYIRNGNQIRVSNYLLNSDNIIQVGGAFYNDVNSDNKRALVFISCCWF
ncbi:MAG: hypothetical protein IPP71_10290 [Bacteroidetes bacterium]|nr:hypothetical protein [Bacteroidota bacterium]